MGMPIVMALSPQADKEALNVRHLPNHVNHQTGETFTGKICHDVSLSWLTASVPLATETAEWLYFAPADVKRVQFTLVPAEQTGQPAEQQRSNRMVNDEDRRPYPPVNFITSDNWQPYTRLIPANEVHDWISSQILSDTGSIHNPDHEHPLEADLCFM